MIRLYIGNLPHHAIEADVVNWFRQAGVAVENTRIMRDLNSNTSKGCGFVDVSTREQALTAMRACNGQKWLGRILVVKGARPPVRRHQRAVPENRYNILRPPIRVVPKEDWPTDAPYASSDTEVPAETRAEETRFFSAASAGGAVRPMHAAAGGRPTKGAA